MRTKLILIVLVILSFSIVNAQNNPFVELRPLKTSSQRLRYLLPDNYFYNNNNGTMQLMMSNDYVGSSFSYFRKTANRFQYGLNVGIIPMASNYQTAQQYYEENEQNKLLLFPFWLSLKIRVRTNLEDKLIPYFIGGLGPTLGLDLGSNNGFIDTISYLRGEIGGGAFIGAGADYLWTDEWAISMDVRYNVFVFDHPLGDDKKFSGFSIYLGFIRAFGL